MMVLDETPQAAAPRGIQRSLVIVGFFVVLLAMLMTMIAARAGRPHLHVGALSAIGVYALPMLMHLFSVRWTYLCATTVMRSKRRAARRMLYKIAALIFLINGTLMAAADAGVDGVLIAGFFGALGPFFLAELLVEETGIWLTNKDTTAGPRTVETRC